MDEPVPTEAGGRLAIDFSDFFRREHLRLGRAIYLICGDPFEAEDLIQEALARAYERWDRRVLDPAKMHQSESRST